MLKVSIVVGNPKPKSRTAVIAQMVVENLFKESAIDLKMIDMADHIGSIFSWPSEEMQLLNDRVAESDLAIFASPTYKAGCTGMLKAFFDRYPANGLNGTVAMAVMTGADLGHSMAPNVNLIPLLLELGASVPVRGLYFNMTQFDRREAVIAAYVDQVSASLVPLRKLADAIPPRAADIHDTDRCTPDSPA